MPCAQHRSALTDCSKLAKSQLPGVKIITIVGYSYPDLPLEPAIRAFEALARNEVRLGPRYEAQFCNLVHPVHREGSVMAWRVDGWPPRADNHSVASNRSSEALSFGEKLEMPARPWLVFELSC